MDEAFLVVFALAASTMALAWAYFRHYQISRPPIGVLNLGDVAFMLGAIIVVPYLYLAAPLWLVAGLLSLGVAGVVYFAVEPVVRSRWGIWTVVFVLVAADIWTALRFGTATRAFFAVNDLVLIVGVIGAVNLWAQSGMKARDAALLAAALALYDFVATSRLPLMDDMIRRLGALPFAPSIVWADGTSARTLGIGLGDMLMATVFPLVMRKAFGKRAGVASLLILLGALGLMLVSLALGVVRAAIPAMVVIGPLMVAQYFYWKRSHGGERTTWEYLRQEPVGSQSL